MAIPLLALRWAAVLVGASLLLAACNNDSIDEVLELTPAEQSGLQQVRGQEKIARDVHLALHGIWRDELFAVLAADEQRHADRAAALIGAFGVFDPVQDDTPGRFANPEWQARYDELVAAGAQSRLEALRAGLRLEESGVVLLSRLVDEDLREAIEDTFRQLLCETRNHLRSLHRELVASGGGYSPQALPAAQFQLLVASPLEACA